MRMTELLKSVFVDVYRLDYSQLFLLLLAATVCFLFLHKRYRVNRLWRFFLGAVLLQRVIQRFGSKDIKPLEGGEY